jgi:hypothetical protein
MGGVISGKQNDRARKTVECYWMLVAAINLVG